MSYRVLFLFLIFAFSAETFSAVVAAPKQKIVGLRVEGVAGLISFSVNPSDTECISRYWVDLREETEKVKFSVAMMAFSAGKDVNLRASPDSNKVFGACKLYDIYVYQ